MIGTLPNGTNVARILAPGTGIPQDRALTLLDAEGIVPPPVSRPARDAAPVVAIDGDRVAGGAVATL